MRDKIHRTLKTVVQVPTSKELLLVDTGVLKCPKLWLLSNNSILSDVVDQVLRTQCRLPKHVQLILDIGVLLLSSNVSISVLRSQYLLVGRV